jgi:Cupin superfamily protein
VADLADPGRVYELFRGGATIVLQSLHRFWPPLARLGHDLEVGLTHPVQVNAYVTPPASRGLGGHHDEHDVFVLQVHGAKRWEVRDPDGPPGEGAGGPLAAADRFWSGRPPVLAGQLQQLLALDQVGDGTAVRRRAGAVCRLRRRGDRLEVVLGDRRLLMPARLEPVMRAVLASDRLVVGDLAGVLDPPSRLVLVRRLVREGLLEAVPQPAP